MSAFPRHLSFNETNTFFHLKKTTPFRNRSAAFGRSGYLFLCPYIHLYVYIHPKIQPTSRFVCCFPNFFFPKKRRTRNVPQVQSFDPHDGTTDHTETDGGTTGWTLEASEVTTAVQSWVLLCHLVQGGALRG